MKTFKTPKGTELPFLNLKGKDYLQVQHRVLWMREEHADWSIETKFLRLDDQVAISQATISDGGKILAQGTKMETPQSFKDGYVEKAESGAIGRALAFIGYGTQFAQELDEDSDTAQIVDSPVPAKPTPLKAVSNDPGSYVIKVGKKWLGHSLEKMGAHDAASYGKYLRDSAKESGKPLTGDWLEAANAIDAFVASREVPRAK